MPDTPSHIPVMLDEVLDLTEPQPGDVALDCTVGRGGHSAAMIERITPGGRLIALDADPANAEFARRRLAPIAESAGVELTVAHANFADAPAALRRGGVERVDLLLADLGFASNQMDDPQRGLSFQQDGPLDMRLDPTLTTTAADLLAKLSEKDLADLIYRYGEERLSRPISRKIVARRGSAPMTNTRELADMCCAAYGPRARRQRTHPATRTFQALRIAVNDELGRLEALLESIPSIASPGARMAIISFHSLEDRAVKQAFRQYAADGLADRVTRKPARPGDHECRANPRSRSAKLRVIRWAGENATGDDETRQSC